MITGGVFLRPFCPLVSKHVLSGLQSVFQCWLLYAQHSHALEGDITEIAPWRWCIDFSTPREKISSWHFCCSLGDKVGAKVPRPSEVGDPSVSLHLGSLIIQKLQKSHGNGVAGQSILYFFLQELNSRTISPELHYDWWINGSLSLRTLFGCSFSRVCSTHAPVDEDCTMVTYCHNQNNCWAICPVVHVQDLQLWIWSPMQQDILVHKVNLDVLSFFGYPAFRELFILSTLAVDHPIPSYSLSPGSNVGDLLIAAASVVEDFDLARTSHCHCHAIMYCWVVRGIGSNDMSSCTTPMLIDACLPL